MEIASIYAVESTLRGYCQWQRQEIEEYSSILLEVKTKYIFTLMSFTIGPFLNIRKDYMMLLKSIVHGTCGFYQEIRLTTTWMKLWVMSMYTFSFLTLILLFIELCYYMYFRVALTVTWFNMCFSLTLFENYKLIFLHTWKMVKVAKVEP